MKKLTKILALLLAVIMAFSMAITVFAEETGPEGGGETEEPEIPTRTLETGKGSIKITNAEYDHEYTIYKILDASYGKEVVDPVTKEKSIPVSYTVDISGGEETYGYKLYEKLTTDTTALAYFDVKPTIDPDIFEVSVKESVTNNTGILSFFKGLDPEEYGFPYMIKECESGNTVMFDNIPFGYYFVKDNADANATLTIDSVAPDANIEIKVPRTPSNSQKVGDKTEVTIGDTVTYNISAKATNFVVSGEDGSVRDIITKYIITDTPDEDAASMTPVSFKVYPLSIITDNYIDENGDLIVDPETGLLKINELEGYTTINKSTNMDEDFKWTTDTEPTDGWYIPKKMIQDSNNNWVVEKDKDGKDVYDLNSVAIPWATKDATSNEWTPIYESTSYIVLTYQQTVGEGIMSYDNGTLDGAFINTANVKYYAPVMDEQKKPSEPVPPSTTTSVAYSTGISLRKLSNLSNDNSTLENAQFKLSKIDGSNTVWYWDNKAEIAAVIAANAKLEEGKEPTEVPKLKVEWKANESDAKVLIADNDYGTVEADALTSGMYTLKEVKAPEGYHVPGYTWDIKIEPSNVENPDKSSAAFIVSFRQTLPNGKTEKEAEEGEDETFKWKAISENGHNYFTVRIENRKGTELPSTGGKGTILLISVGLLFILIGGVVLITKKRMYNEGR